MFIKAYNENWSECNSYKRRHNEFLRTLYEQMVLLSKLFVSLYSYWLRLYSYV